MARKRPQQTYRQNVITSSILAVVFVAAVVADGVYGVTPLNDLRPISKLDRVSAPRSDLKLTVRDAMTLKDDLSGSFAEVEGTLDYSESMHRFHLYSLEEKNQYISAYFHRGKRTSLGQSLAPDRGPRYLEFVQPLIGKHVRMY
ncbi:MAG: hypothetical protein ABJA83_04805 [Burkholderiaceae bacterium]